MPKLSPATDRSYSADILITDKRQREKETISACENAAFSLAPLGVKANAFANKDLRDGGLITSLA